ncbi:hypothetical protein KI387_006198, partial [Taxus chinensis]
ALQHLARPSGWSALNRGLLAQWPVQLSTHGCRSARGPVGQHGRVEPGRHAQPLVEVPGPREGGLVCVGGGWGGVLGPGGFEHMVSLRKVALQGRENLLGMGGPGGVGSPPRLRQVGRVASARWAGQRLAYGEVPLKGRRFRQSSPGSVVSIGHVPPRPQEGGTGSA